MTDIEKEVLQKQFDTYIKKTIKNTVINYKKYENKKSSTEVSIEELNDFDTSVPFSLEGKHLVDFLDNDKLISIVSQLKPIQIQILELKILDVCTSKEIAELLGKSDSRIRHIYSDTINEIKNKMKEI